jgi:hypothetical protein
MIFGNDNLSSMSRDVLDLGPVNKMDPMLNYGSKKSSMSIFTNQDLRNKN